MSRRDTAVQLLEHYITLLMRKAGLKPDSDTHAELEDLVDAIVDAAVSLTPSLTQRYAEIDDRLVEIVRRLDKHERQLKAEGR
jgi:hypothetical protein